MSEHEVEPRSWHHKCICGIAAGLSLVVEHDTDCPFGKRLDAIIAARLADAEARAENRGIRLAAELVRGHSIDGTGAQIARFLEARADRRMTAEQARGDQ